MINRKQIEGFSLLFIAALASFALAFHLPWMAPPATRWVVAWAGVERLIGFYLLAWAMHRSDNVFYASFVGGILFRLASLGAVAALLYMNHVPLLIPLLSLVFLSFLFSLLQVPYITYGLW